MYTQIVVFASTFTSKKGDVFTRLYVPVVQDVVDVLVRGDKTALVGVECPFDLYVKDGQLKLRLHIDGKED